MAKKDEEKGTENKKKAHVGVLPVKSVTLTSDFCNQKQLGSFTDYVNYVVEENGQEQPYRLKLDITTFPASKKADLTAIAQERFPKDPMTAKEFENELVVAEALGLDHIDVVNLKATKPAGVWDSIVYLVNSRLGTFAGLTQRDVDEAKNVVGQE